MANLQAGLEAFARLIRKHDSLRNPDAALAYVRASVCNLTRNRHRHLRVVRLRTPFGWNEDSSEQAAILREDHREVLAALAGLPPRRREAIVLRYWLDLSEREIAAAMGVSPGTVKSNVSRGLAALAAAAAVAAIVAGMTSAVSPSAPVRTSTAPGSPSRTATPAPTGTPCHVQGVQALCASSIVRVKRGSGRQGTVTSFFFGYVQAGVARCHPAGQRLPGLGYSVPGRLAGIWRPGSSRSSCRRRCFRGGQTTGPRRRAR